jgi:murein tripeptide amidase MpaA
MLNGFLDLLMDSKNPLSRSLLSNFVLKIVPALNPDGIYRGYYRLDTLGQNLNRHYLEPCTEKQPTTYSVKNIMKQLAEDGNLFMYVDFHAHASKKGIFCFGNCLSSEEQADNVLFARLMSLNCLNFDMTE